jgi:hypothetical protein
MFESEKICPRCQTARLKNWDELTSDEKFVVERLPKGAEFSGEERKRHSFCPRCWFETENAAEKV